MKPTRPIGGQPARQDSIHAPAVAPLPPSAAPRPPHPKDVARRWRESHVTKTMWPPQPGTVRFMTEHGPQLVCVRYRQDANGLRRYTTIEIAVDQAMVTSAKAKRQKLEVAIAYEEVELRAMARQLGAKWNAQKRTWELSGDAVQRLKLTNRARRSNSTR